MNKKTQKKYVALLTMLAMVICTMFCTNTAKADTESSWDPSDVVKVTKCTVNGSERTLTTLKNGRVFFQVDNQTPEYMCDFSYMIDVGIDKYGTIWYISTSVTDICWWNYDITGYEDQAFRPIRDNSYSPIIDVESLIFDNDNLVIGYKTKDGQSHSTLTFDEMKSSFPSGGDEDDDPTPTPTPTVPATTPPAPTVSPVAIPPTTSTPAVTPKTTVTPKVSVKKKAGYNCLSLGSKITSKYKLVKGKLTWKGSSKSKKYSGIKSAAFIKKSGNLVFLTKKGKVYTLSPKGKKKCIVKKKAKKLILKNKFAVKVKVGKKFINIANK
mgnify:FL=1